MKIFEYKMIMAMHVSKYDCLKYVNRTWCRYITSTQTGMEEGMLREASREMLFEYFRGCFAECFPKCF